jgi:hypothetical protein
VTDVLANASAYRQSSGATSSSATASGAAATPTSTAGATIA